MTGSCHSAPVCCALFHSDDLAGMEKSRMCREGSAGSCLGHSALSPQAGGTRPQHPELSGSLCCHRTVRAPHGAVTSPRPQRGSKDVPSLFSALLPALPASDRAVGQGSFGASLSTLLRGGDQPKSYPHSFLFKASSCHLFPAQWNILCNMTVDHCHVLIPQRPYQEKGFSRLEEDLLQQFSSNQI